MGQAGGHVPVRALCGRPGRLFPWALTCSLLQPGNPAAKGLPSDPSSAACPARPSLQGLRHPGALGPESGSGGLIPGIWSLPSLGRSLLMGSLPALPSSSSDLLTPELLELLRALPGGAELASTILGAAAPAAPAPAPAPAPALPAAPQPPAQQLPALAQQQLGSLLGLAAGQQPSVGSLPPWLSWSLDLLDWAERAERAERAAKARGEAQAAEAEAEAIAIEALASLPPSIVGLGSRALLEDGPQLDHAAPAPAPVPAAAAAESQPKPEPEAGAQLQGAPLAPAAAAAAAEGQTKPEAVEAGLPGPVAAPAAGPASPEGQLRQQPAEGEPTAPASQPALGAGGEAAPPASPLLPLLGPRGGSSGAAPAEAGAAPQPGGQLGWGAAAAAGAGGEGGGVARSFWSAFKQPAQGQGQQQRWQQVWEAQRSGASPADVPLPAADEPLPAGGGSASGSGSGVMEQPPPASAGLPDARDAAEMDWEPAGGGRAAGPAAADLQEEAAGSQQQVAAPALEVSEPPCRPRVCTASAGRGGCWPGHGHSVMHRSCSWTAACLMGWRCRSQRPPGQQLSGPATESRACPPERRLPPRPLPAAGLHPEGQPAALQGAAGPARALCAQGGARARAGGGGG